MANKSHSIIVARTLKQKSRTKYWWRELSLIMWKLRSTTSGNIASYSASLLAFWNSQRSNKEKLFFSSLIHIKVMWTTQMLCSKERSDDEARLDLSFAGVEQSPTPSLCGQASCAWADRCSTITFRDAGWRAEAAILKLSTWVQKDLLTPLMFSANDREFLHRLNLAYWP